MMRCATPGCEDERIDPRRFCSPCGDRLDRIRVELQTEGARMSAAGGVANKTINKRSGPQRARVRKAPTCCREGCWNTRIAPEPFCDECRAMGYEPQED